MKCRVAACEREADGSRGYCDKHYRRWLRYGNPMKTVRWMDHPSTCQAEGCERPWYSKGRCHLHYEKALRQAKRAA